ncbi:MAG: hypothetical protein KGL04_02680 [Elusimicrobia bacterium]|nr:hypothetical protein [Elusimicrobiota bacterium]
MGRFRAQDLAAQTGYSLDHVYAGLGPLIRDGLVSKQPDGSYTWIGG